MPIRIAWISDFPIEWMPDLPLPLQSLPKQHPSTWQVVLLSELEKNPALQIYVIVLRKQVKQNFTFEKNGVVFHILKVPGGLRAPSFFWLDTFLINRVLKKIQPDLVHAWGVEKGAATVASRLDYPHLITLQGLFTWLKELVPVGNYQRFIALCETISFKRIKMATTESAFAVQYLKTKYPKLQVFQAEHAPNWIFHRIQRRPQIQPVRFVCVATLGYAKGTDLLLRALDELAREFCFELVLIGAPNPTFLNSLKSTVSPEFWRRIVLKTDLSPPEVAEELATATMLLLPTRADTSPNAVKEAVVAGVPVVASAIGGIVDYVFPGKNGFLFPSNNLDEFIKSIRAACQHPLFSRGEVDAEALKKSREYLSPQTMGRRFLEAYEKALKLGNV
ncbi:MAG: glycosyltransferase [Verrucomicrobiota bacterium]